MPTRGQEGGVTHGHTADRSGPPAHPGRRMVLRAAGYAMLAGVAARRGLVSLAHAAQQIWPAQAFAQKNEADLLKVYFNGKAPVSSDKITLDVPEIAENGAVVPVKVSTTLPDVTRVSLLVPENPFTLTAAYDIPAGTEPTISCRLKMAKTAKVIAVVESGGNNYLAERSVKVTLGGCG